MAEKDQRPIPPEGRSRGPIIHSGGEQDIENPPPYSDRQQTGKSPEELAAERSGTGHEAGPTPTSQEEREGVSATEMDPAGPHGVGISTTSQGNEQARSESAESLRKTRHETASTGVGSSKPKDPEMPDLQPGDQGG